MDRKKRRHWHWLGILGAVLVPALATAALVIPNTFVANTTIKSADVNANFAAVVTHANGVDSAITALQTQVKDLQAASAIAYAHVGGATVYGFGGLGTTAATVSGNGFPYTITFTGTYPSVSATKLVVEATAESGMSMLANATCGTLTTTTISCYVYVWQVTTAGTTTTNGAYLTVRLGR